ncbi:uncharacterized protein LOC135806488 [Sycon ciliatum]|uniref:uncharacterized protein LOC135806488 n=1 Tax=Sycon ciliatum TaxID=27933 RepID=UPI0031F70303
MTSRDAPFGTDEQPRYDTKIVGGRSVLRPIDTQKDVTALDSTRNENASEFSALGIKQGNDNVRSMNKLDLGKECPGGAKELNSHWHNTIPDTPVLAGRKVLRKEDLPGGEQISRLGPSSLPMTIGHPSVLPPIASTAGAGDVNVERSCGESSMLDQSLCANNTLPGRCSTGAAAAAQGRSTTCSTAVRDICDEIPAMMLDRQQMYDLLKELQVINVTKSGLLTEERLQHITRDICPSLSQAAVSKFVERYRSEHTLDGDNERRLLIDCAAIIAFLERLMPPASQHDIEMSTMLSQASVTQVGSAPKAFELNRLSALKRQMSSSEPSLLTIGQRPAPHAVSMKLPTPQVKKEMAANDALNISSAILASTQQKDMQLEQRESAERLRQRHDAKLLLAVERDWMEAMQSANSTAAEQCNIDFQAFQLALGQLDSERTGSTLYSQVLQACRQHKLPISTQTLHHLCRRCDHSSDGYVRWVELLDFLERARPIQLQGASTGSDGTANGTQHRPNQHFQKKPSGLSAMTLLPESLSIEAPGQYSKLHLPKIERLKAESPTTAILKSPSMNSLCDKNKALQGMRRLQAALKMSADSSSAGGQTDVSTAQRLVNMHNTVYQFSLPTDCIQRFILESRVPAIDDGLSVSAQRCSSAGSHNSKASQKHLDVRKNLSCSSASSMGRPRTPCPVLISMLVKKLCDHLDISEVEMEDSKDSEPVADL